MTKQIIKKLNKKSALIIVLVLALISVFAYTQLRSSNEPTVLQTADGGTVNLDPPTAEEKQAGDSQKQKNEQQSAPQTGQKSVKPVITSAGQFDNPQYGQVIEVRTLVTGVYESGGMCTATFKLGQAVVTKQVEALQDATTTRCDVVIIPRSEFPSAGEWELTVSYASASYSGQSDATKVSVQ